MEKSLNKKIDLKLTESGEFKHVAVSVKATEKVFNYQIEMINHNPMVHIVPFQMVRKDDFINFDYDITSKIPLSQFLKKRPLSKNEFIDLLIFIIEIICNCRDYLLFEKCLLFNGDYIFVNEDKIMEISMIYIPIELNENVSIEFKNFVMRLIISSVTIDEKDCDNFIQIILEKLRDETFTVQRFKELLMSFKGDRIIDIENDDSIGVFQDSNFSKQSPDVLKKDKKISSKNILSEQATSAEKMMNLPKIIIVIMSQLLILGTLTTLYLTGITKNIIKDMTTVSIMLIIIAGFDFLAVRKIIECMNRNINANNLIDLKGRIETLKNTGITKGKINADLPPRAPKKLIKIERINQEESTNQNMQMFYIEKKEKESPERNKKNISNDTVFLAPPKKIYPCLKSLTDGGSQEINIVQDRFVIGRDEENVDLHLINIAVGKIHAEIIKENGKYSISDLDSKNGTFLNKERLESNRQYSVSNNDHITFANCEFVFLDNRPKP